MFEIHLFYGDTESRLVASHKDWKGQSPEKEITNDASNADMSERSH